MIDSVRHRVNLIRRLTLRRWVRQVILCLSLFAWPGFTGLSAQSKIRPADLEFFEKRVRPVLSESCYGCHSSESKKLKAGLALDHSAGLFAGGDTGPAIVPGDPDRSLLVTAVAYDDPNLQMPPDGKLGEESIADLREWIRLGAPWPDSEIERAPRLVEDGFRITAEDRAHWAFQPVGDRELPGVTNGDWVRNPIDTFILARLEARQLSPAPPASKQALIRRATYDLTGLPPSPEEVEAFLADLSSQAYESLVDRLLASPRYGEKWGRHWLDLVRFAESNSYERDNPKPNAWRFRDYVIRAFNSDKPSWLRRRAPPPRTRMRPSRRTSPPRRRA